MAEWKKRLVSETEELAVKVNKLQAFMGTRTFFELDRERKSKMYRQLHYMLSYLEVLGERIELEGVQDLFTVEGTK